MPRDSLCLIHGVLPVVVVGLDISHYKMKPQIRYKEDSKSD